MRIFNLESDNSEIVQWDLIGINVDVVGDVEAGLIKFQTRNLIEILQNYYD